MKTEMKEEWRTVQGYGGNIEVSDQGHVRAKNWNKTGQMKELNLHVNPKTGYVTVGLYDPEIKKSRSVLVHRLVALAFIPNPNQLEQIDHIDSDKQNNVKDNLRWASRRFNNSRPHARLMRAKNRKYTKHKGKEMVKATNSETGEVLYFQSSLAASRHIGCSSVLATMAINGGTRTAKGWKLEYIPIDSPECQETRMELEQNRQSKLKKSKKETERNRRRQFKKQVMKRLEAELRADFIARIEGRIERYVAMDLRRKQLKSEMRKVVQCSLDGTPLKIWSNRYQAQLQTGLNGIEDCLYGLSESCGGYKWNWKIPTAGNNLED